MHFQIDFSFFLITIKHQIKIMTSKGRKPLDLRPIKVEQGILGHHDGSALFSFGPVSALAAISGPSEVRIRDEKTDRSTLQIQFIPLHGIAGTSSITFEHSLQGIWQNVFQTHLFPRSLIQIHLQTYACPPNLIQFPLRHHKQSNPIEPPPTQSPHPDAPIPVSLKAAQINATTLACLDAAIPMRCMVAATSAVVIRKGVRSNFMRGWRAGESEVDQTQSDEFEVLLDPTPYEESLAKSSHVFAFSFEQISLTNSAVEPREVVQQSQLVYSDSQGTQTGSDYLDCLTLCRQSSQEIVRLMRNTMAKRLLGSEISSSGELETEDVTMAV